MNRLLGQLYMIPMVLIGLGFLSGLFRWKTIGYVQKVVTCLLGLTLVVELISRSLWKLEINTYPLFHIYAPIQYSILTWAYIKIFDFTMFNLILKLSIPLFLVYSLMNTIFWQPLTIPNSNVTTALSIIMVSLSVCFYFRLLSQMKYKQLERSAVFWLNNGIVVYFAGSLLMFVYGEWLVDKENMISINIWLTHVFFLAIHYLCFNIALWMKPE